MQIIELPYTSDSAQVFAKLADLPWAAYLDSCQQGRYDILTALPYVTLCTVGNVTQIETDKGIQLSEENPFNLVRKYLKQGDQQVALTPFSGGALGYFSYDLARQLEQLPTLAKQDVALPEMAVGIYDWAIVVDHVAKTIVFSSRHPDRWRQIQKRLEQELPQVESFRLTQPFQSNLSKQEYSNAFSRIQHYIREGDCYQVNLSQRFSAGYQGSPWYAYQQLRKLSPVPYAAYLNHPHAAILSLSPERFLQVQENKVETKPIKGTRPRGSTSEQDQQLGEELVNSLKDRAENLMIVDLLRNDLGKNCRFGSIQVPYLFKLESFATVHHLVSTITGTLQEEKDSIDLLRDCFPGGSVTGAPKLRAMEIIEELEPNRRNLYCGSIGYIGFDGNMDTNIAIRTLVCQEQSIYCSAGGALIADSQCEDEYQETLTKVNKLLKLIENL